MNETENLKRQVEELMAWKKSLENAQSIPLNIDQAFRARFISGGVVTSTKSSSSENQAVNEGGVATYSVLKTPDGFLQVTIGSTIYYIPIFT